MQIIGDGQTDETRREDASGWGTERRTAIGKRLSRIGYASRSRRVNVTHPPRATNLPGRRRVKGQHAETADRLRGVIASEARVCVHLIIIVAESFIACTLLGCHHLHTALHLHLHVSHRPKLLPPTPTTTQSNGPYKAVFEASMDDPSQR